MGVRVKANRHGFLALQIRFAGWGKWIGTKLRDEGRNRRLLEAQAVLIEEALRRGIKLREALRQQLKYEPEGMMPDETPVEVPKPPMTIGEYYEVWIRRQIPPRIRANTAENRKIYFDAAILPRFADMPLRNLSPSMLLDFQTELLKAGPKGQPLNVRTVKMILNSHFQALFSEARDVDGLVEGNPFTKVPWPDVPEDLPDPFTEEERDKILNYVRVKLAQFYPWIFFQFWEGTRPSESTALRVSDVDVNLCKAAITRSAVRGHVGPPKTRASRRVIDLFPWVVDVLKSATRALHERPDDPFFRNLDGGAIRQDTWAVEYWHRILRATGVRPRRFYATRATFISVALTNGEDILLVAEHCGTSVTMIEKHYGRYIKPERFERLRAAVQSKTSGSNLRGKERRTVNHQGLLHLHDERQDHRPTV
jgi:integrase